MQKRRITISDIAQELGLSTATVSNVIHGKTNKVSEETIIRVQALLEERQYIPSMAGILLSQNTSRIIGVVVKDHEKYEGHIFDDFFVAASLNYLSVQIERNDQFMMVKKARYPEEIIKFASMWNLDGLVLLGFCSEDYVYLRSHMRIPFVVYDGCGAQESRYFNITIADYDGGYQAGKFLRNSNHTQALCISDNAVCVDQKRFEGFCAGFCGNVERFLVPIGKAERWAYYDQKLDKILRASAAFAVSDYYAIDFLHYLQHKNITVPDQMSVIGFDDTPLCQMISPQLSSVHQDLELRAAIAIEKIGELKRNASTENSVCLPVKLVLRQSTRKISK